MKTVRGSLGKEAGVVQDAVTAFSVVGLSCQALDFATVVLSCES